MWNHFVARACTPHEPFKDFELARRTWERLEAFFPAMLAGVLMPNHLHLILPVHPPNRHKLRNLLGAISKEKKAKSLWQPIPEPTLIPDSKHLRRQIRYLALNPCRDRICTDPLEWYWSTYRSSIGAAAKQSRSQTHDVVDFHAYVSSDPSVRVTGTPFPKSAPPRQRAHEGIEEILSAAAAAMRAPLTEVSKCHKFRKLFVHLAYRQGWKQPVVLAEICGITPRAVAYIMSRPQPAGLEAAALCLGDKRLRSHPI